MRMVDHMQITIARRRAVIAEDESDWKECRTASNDASKIRDRKSSVSLCVYRKFVEEVLASIGLPLT